MHIGGFTVFGVIQNRVQGIIECFPTTTNRLSVKNAESSEAFRAWGNRQLKNPGFQRLKPPQLSEALIGLWDLGVDISDHYFLWNLHGEMVFFHKMQLANSPTIFLAVVPAPSPWLAIGQFVFPMQTGSAVEQSPDFTYVLNNNFGSSSFYNRIHLLGQENAQINRTAYGQLLKLLDDHGFETQIEGPQNYVIGTYTGPNGGMGYLKNPSLRNGDPIQARGIVIRTNPKLAVD